MCDSRGLEFVANISHKCSRPRAQATQQNLKKIASPEGGKRTFGSHATLTSALRDVLRNPFRPLIYQLLKTC